VGINNALSVSFLALLVACLGRMLLRRPAVVHGLWLLVLLKLVTPPLYEISVPWSGSLGGSAAPKPPLALVAVERELESERRALARAEARVFGLLDAHAGVIEPFNAKSVPPAASQPVSQSVVNGVWRALDWRRLLVAIWLAGSATTLVLALYRIVRFQLLLRQARPACEEEQEWASELGLGLGLTPRAELWFVDAKFSPMLWVLGVRPRLIIPEGLWKGLGKRERATVILHELAHLRRGDHLVRFLELAVTVLYWWHPVLWWARKALRDVEEQCCDAWVVWAFPDAAKCYAETLLQALDFLNESGRFEPLLASGFGKVQHLRRRLTMIMLRNTPRVPSLWGTLGSLSLAAVLLPVNPSWAQKAAKPEAFEIEVETVDDPVIAIAPHELREPGEDSVVVLSADGKQIIAKELTELPVLEDVGVGGDGRAIVLHVDGPEHVSADGKTTVRLVVKGDDASEVLVAGSIDEAKAKLKEKLKALASQSESSEHARAHRRAVERAIEQLDKVSKELKELERSDSGKKATSEKLRNVEARKAVVVRRLNEIRQTQLTEEQKAAIQEARARAERVAKEIEAKHKELAEIRSQIRKLEGTRAEIRARLAPARVESRTHSESRTIVRPEVRAEVKERIRKELDTRLKEAAAAAGAARRAEARESSDRARIEKLESKLKELLEEVVKLRREREPRP
jgi:beta-lactamase regulating signal transducer with metallopeptidase domain